MKNQIKARVRRLAHERAADMIDRIRKEEEEKRQVLESFYLVNFHVLTQKIFGTTLIQALDSSSTDFT